MKQKYIQALQFFMLRLLIPLRVFLSARNAIVFQYKQNYYDDRSNRIEKNKHLYYNSII